MLKNKSDSFIPNYVKSKRISEPEFLNLMSSVNFCINATTDPTINKMEIKNIYFNIIRLGQFIPEYDPSLNVF